MRGEVEEMGLQAKTFAEKSAVGRPDDGDPLIGW
jgi:hypothetical protein